MSNYLYRVLKSSCPFLGLKADPASIYLEPTEMHRCSVGGRGREIQLDHQAKYCLAGNYLACPLHPDAGRRESAASARSTRRRGEKAAVARAEAEPARATEATAAAQLLPLVVPVIQPVEPAPSPAAVEALTPPAVEGHAPVLPVLVPMLPPPSYIPVPRSRALAPLPVARLSRSSYVHSPWVLAAGVTLMGIIAALIWVHLASRPGGKVQSLR